MGRSHTTSLVFITMMFFAISCTSTRGANGSDEELADLAQQLGYVAVAVHGLVRFGNPPADLTGEQLVIEATKDNPALLNPLSGYFVAARREGRLSSVLMCDIKRHHAVAEDAGCTSSRLDAPLWQTSLDSPCSFTLDLWAICGSK